MLRIYEYCSSNNVKLLRRHIQKLFIITFKDAFEKTFSMLLRTMEELLTIEDATEAAIKDAIEVVIEDAIEDIV